MTSGGWLWAALSGASLLAGLWLFWRLARTYRPGRARGGRDVTGVAASNLTMLGLLGLLAWCYLYAGPALRN